MQSGTRGLFVAFEGGEGAGKSTQIALLAGWARESGREVLETREPGGTALGIELRGLVLDPEGHVTPRAELLLYAADRAQHVEAVIRPALAAGQLVVTDRYLDSTIAYQGAGRGLGSGARMVTEWAVDGLLPDLTVLLDIDPTVGLARVRARSALDRLESASMNFHLAVREEFRALAAAAPQRYLVLDGTSDTDELAAQVRGAVGPLLG